MFQHSSSVPLWSQAPASSPSSQSSCAWSPASVSSPGLFWPCFISSMSIQTCSGPRQWGQWASWSSGSPNPPCFTHCCSHGLFHDGPANKSFLLLKPVLDYFHCHLSSWEDWFVTITIQYIYQTSSKAFVRACPSLDRRYLATPFYRVFPPEFKSNHPLWMIQVLE